MTTREKGPPGHHHDSMPKTKTAHHVAAAGRLRLRNRRGDCCCFQKQPLGWLFNSHKWKSFHSRFASLLGTSTGYSYPRDNASSPERFGIFFDVCGVVARSGRAASLPLRCGVVAVSSLGKTSCCCFRCGTLLPLVMARGCEEDAAKAVLFHPQRRRGPMTIGTISSGGESAQPFCWPCAATT